MATRREAVITGVGVVSPIGIGLEAFRDALYAGRSGVRPLTLFDASELPVDFGGEVTGFDPKVLVRPRKSLKVMSREIQFGFAAADMAFGDAGLAPGGVDPDRFGVVFGADMIYCDPDELAAAFRACLVEVKFDFDRWGSHALPEMYPLWLLKYLPNMSACHVGIALDARGPNNTITLGDVSSVVAIAEAVSVIERGWADVMLSGGSGGRLHPGVLPFRDVRWLSRRREEPERASRPFDADRDGMAIGEGAGSIVLEDRRHAEARGAKIWGTIRGWANGFLNPTATIEEQAAALERVLRLALTSAKVSVEDIGHVSANGMATVHHDWVEAAAIERVLGDVPVTAPKGHFGNLSAAGKAVEMVASLLALDTGKIPPTVNYERPDPACPINIVHGAPRSSDKPAALLISTSYRGQMTAMVLSRA